ncbi:hypothetical protein OE88DRAFT_1740439 [Heliocybe sulcata]|uniref:RlpA-like protein double-psi beta-barrel domain-containing protein n=1 Tax=Heliocybe sulcata TaxID=5364 RepID=A0A5C3MKT0_9AGAM|nr:hypothetical protein OE88DRAFT_1740439 [Heliocybe sulcata]
MLSNSKSLALVLVLVASLGVARAAHGDATWYNPGQGACGATSSSNDLVVALSSSAYAGGAHCFNHITVYYQGKKTDATVVDECPGCKPGDLDLSPGAFSALESLGAGRIQVDWEFA